LRAELLNVWHGLTDIAGIAKSSEGHPGGCPFSLAFLELRCGRREGAGSLRERGLGGGSVEGGERRVGGSATGGWFFLTPHGFAGSLRGAVACAPSD